MVEPRPHRPLGTLEDLGDLAVTQTIEREERQYETVNRREIRECPLQAEGFFVALEHIVRIAFLAGVLLQRARPPLALREHSTRYANRNAEEPCANLRATFELLPGSESLKESLLRDVLGVMAISSDAPSEGMHCVEVLADDRIELISFGLHLHLERRREIPFTKFRAPQGAAIEINVCAS